MVKNNNNKKPNKSAKLRVQQPKLQNQVVVRSQYMPAALGNRVTQHEPRIAQHHKGISISHSEYISDITCDANGAATGTYICNPGRDNTFPWLSEIARNYEMYRFKKLSFMFMPLLPTSATGAVGLAFDYDVEDPHPSTKQALYAKEGSVRSSIWTPVRVRADASMLNAMGPKRYMSYDGAATSKVYDAAKLVYRLASTESNGTSIGEFWVEYEIELFNPQLRPTLTAKASSAAGETVTCSKTSPYQGWVRLAGQLPVRVLSGVAEQVAFNFRNAGSYIMTGRFIGTGASGISIAGVNAIVTQLTTQAVDTTGRWVVYLIERLGRSQSGPATPFSILGSGQDRHLSLDFNAWTSLASSLITVAVGYGSDYTYERELVFEDEEKNFKFYRAVKSTDSVTPI